MYEYANRLSLRGYSVHLTYPLKTRFMEYRLPYFVRLVLSKVERFRTNKWFPFNPNITMSYVDSISENNMRDSDIIIGTWWSTMLEIGKLSDRKGKKINLIQGFENWIGHDDLLYKSYDLPATTNVVVATYLRDIVTKHTKNNTLVIPNAIDSNEYFVSIDIENRIPFTISMMYSIQDIKGSKFGLEALFLVKEKFPDLKVNLFGICPEPEGLPKEWISFIRDPQNICEIHNQNSIFIANSLTEGMALTPLEAMFCGCALICTDIDGHSEYAIDGETALLYEVKNVEQLAEKIVYLMQNNDQRIEIAKRGNEFAKQFTWDKAVDKMEMLIQSLLQEEKI